MKKEDLLRHLRARQAVAVQGYAEHIEAIDRFKFKTAYYVKNMFGESLVMVKTFNQDSIRLKFIANKAGNSFPNNLDGYCVSFRYQARGLDGLKEVPLSDLPLYVSWKWVSPEFEKLLKGTNK